MTAARKASRTDPVSSPWAAEKPKREALRGEKREAILRTAASLFASKGIEATSMDDVANALGITKPTVYRQFGDKSELLEACFARATKPFLDLLKETRARGGSAIEQIRHYLIGDLRFMLEDEFGQMLMMPGIADLYSNKSPTNVRAMEQIRSGIRAIIREGIRNGEIKATVDPHLLSLALFATINRVTRWYDPVGRYTPDAIIDHYLEIFLDGVRAPKSKAKSA